MEGATATDGATAIAAAGEETAGLPAEPRRGAARRDLPAGPLPALGPDGVRLAVVCEQATAIGGTERVRDAILARYPAAPNYVFGLRGSAASRPERIDGARPVAGWGPHSHFLAPLYALQMSRLEPAGARVVLSLSSHAWGLAPRIPEGAVHIAYVCGAPPSLHPPRTEDYVGAHHPALRPLLRAARPGLRALSRRLMRRPETLVANSTWSADQVLEHCGRRAEVVFPPVRTGFFTPGEAGERSGLLVVGRLVSQKRIEVAIEAARLAGERLVVVGDGPRLGALRRMARPGEVEFAGAVGDEELRRLYRSARALISPNVEEFGLVMAEAQACGTPVVAPRQGGALDIVSGPGAGALADGLDADSLAAAARRLLAAEPRPDRARASAERFSEDRFIAGLERVIAGRLERAGG